MVVFILIQRCSTFKDYNPDWRSRTGLKLGRGANVGHVFAGACPPKNIAQYDKMFLTRASYTFITTIGRNETACLGFNKVK